MSLQVTDLRVYYRTLAGDVKALDGATFSIADKEIMGLAGESGCGKSTLGNSLIRLDGRMKYVAGSVNLDGNELADLGQRRHERVPLPGRLGHPAVRHERHEPDAQDREDDRRAARVSRRELQGDQARADASHRSRRAGSADVLNRYPIELSGGMKQRMVMVISTLLNPSLLIADEITSALDVSTQRAVAETLVSFRDHGFVKSMMVITHDVSILYQIADTILIMYAGKLAEKAPTKTHHRRAATSLHAGC